MTILPIKSRRWKSLASSYAKAKLEAARKRLAIETSINSSSEGLDKAQQDVKDWEARVKTLQAQLDQVDNELQAALKGTEGTGALIEGLILPGENVEVFVVEDPSFNGRYPVRRGGYIIMPAVWAESYVAGKGFKGGGRCGEEGHWRVRSSIMHR